MPREHATPSIAVDPLIFRQTTAAGELLAMIIAAAALVIIANQTAITGGMPQAIATAFVVCVFTFCGRFINQREITFNEKARTIEIRTYWLLLCTRVATWSFCAVRAIEACPYGEDSRRLQLFTARGQSITLCYGGMEDPRLDATVTRIAELCAITTANKVRAN